MNKNILIYENKYYLIEDIQVHRVNNCIIGKSHNLNINYFHNFIYKIKVLNLPPNIEYCIKITTENNDIITSSNSINGVLEINNCELDQLLIPNDKFEKYQLENKCTLNKYLDFNNFINVDLIFNNNEAFEMKRCIVVGFVYSLFKS